MKKKERTFIVKKCVFKNKNCLILKKITQVFFFLSKRNGAAFHSDFGITRPATKGVDCQCPQCGSAFKNTANISKLKTFKEWLGANVTYH